MLYHLYDLRHAALTPWRVAAELTQSAFQNPLLPASYTQFGRTIAAAAEVFQRTTRRFGKPEFGLPTATVDGEQVAVNQRVVCEKPFGGLIHFERATKRKQPKILLVTPLSGHYATLLRGTVAGLINGHDVYVTDWADARQVPLRHGSFDLDDYIQYVMDFLAFLGPDTHVIAVCQPAVPVLAAVSLMAARNDPNQPRSMTLMGGPIDTTAAPTAVTKLAETRSIDWFERTVITTVPAYYPGAFRRVYPGFVQLTGFMSMNLDRHITEHFRLYQHLVRGDGDSADAHRAFYDEYLAVMDLPAEFYLQTVETVFQRHDLPKGTMTWRGQPVDPSKIRHTALMTVEGELDDISAPGQTLAAHRLCSGLSAAKKEKLLQAKVGHYGIFNGRRWREQILPKVSAFVLKHDRQAASTAGAESRPAIVAEDDKIDASEALAHSIWDARPTMNASVAAKPLRRGSVPSKSFRNTRPQTARPN